MHMTKYPEYSVHSNGLTTCSGYAINFFVTFLRSQLFAPIINYDDKIGCVTIMVNK